MTFIAGERYNYSMKTDQASTAIVVLPAGDQDLKLIRSTLKKVGFTVVSSETGNEIPALLNRPEEPLRLVVADTATPGLDFPQLLKELDEADSPARVLCLCEKGQDALHTCGDSDRIGGRLERPFRRARLLASILDTTDKPLARTA
jgi:DNA-binding NtrC family response regulator